MSKVKVAKFAANIAIQTIVSGVVSNKIKEHTEIETTTDQVAVAVASGVAGYIIADYTSRVVIDPLIDRVAAWNTARKTDETNE